MPHIFFFSVVVAVGHNFKFVSNNGYVKLKHRKFSVKWFIDLHGLEIPFIGLVLKTKNPKIIANHKFLGNKSTWWNINLQLNNRPYRLLCPQKFVRFSSFIVCTINAVMLMERPAKWNSVHCVTTRRLWISNHFEKVNLNLYHFVNFNWTSRYQWLKRLCMHSEAECKQHSNEIVYFIPSAQFCGAYNVYLCVCVYFRKVS